MKKIDEHRREGPQGFTGGPVVKNQPASTGDTGSIPDSGRSHVLRSNEAPTTTTEPVLYLEAWELQALRRIAPQSLCATREATTERSSRAAAR